jgi:hypothetical protein
MKIKLDNPERETFYCPIKKHRGKALLNCPNCEHYPCSVLRVQDFKYLEDNLKHEYEWLEKVRDKMVIVEKEDGTLEKREKFNVTDPTEKELKGVAKVYVASKCYEKKVKLTPIREKVEKPVKKGGKNGT